MSNLNFYISRAQGHNQAISVNHFINENFSKYLSKIVEVLNEDITYKINQDNSIERAQDAWDAQVTDLKVTNHTIETFFNKLKKYHEIEEGEIVLFNNNQTQFNLENFIKFLESKTNKTLDENSNISEVSNGSTTFEFKITTNPKNIESITNVFKRIINILYNYIDKNNNFINDSDFKNFVEKINDNIEHEFKFEFKKSEKNKKQTINRIKNPKICFDNLSGKLTKITETDFDEFKNIIEKLNKNNNKIIDEGIIKDLKEAIFNSKSKVNIQYFPNPLTGVTGTIAGS
jgi:hypothetical protein